MEGAEKDLLSVYTVDTIHRYRIRFTFTGALSPSLPYRLNGNQQELKHIFNISPAYLFYPTPLENLPIP